MSIVDRDVLLCSGARYPLISVSRSLTLVGTYLAEADGRHFIHDLRQLCLGFDVTEHAKADLQRCGLLAKDGTLDSVMKAVVLAAVRGEEHNLYIVSPFTTSLDRALGEFLGAREHLRAELSEEEAQQVFSEKDMVSDVLQTWAMRAKRPVQPPGPDTPG